MAKNVFNEIGTTYKVIELDEHNDGKRLQEALAQITGARTVRKKTLVLCVTWSGLCIPMPICQYLCISPISTSLAWFSLSCKVINLLLFPIIISGAKGLHQWKLHWRWLRHEDASSTGQALASYWTVCPLLPGAQFRRLCRGPVWIEQMTNRFNSRDSTCIYWTFAWLCDLCFTFCGFYVVYLPRCIAYILAYFFIQECTVFWEIKPSTFNKTPPYSGHVCRASWKMDWAFMHRERSLCVSCASCLSIINIDYELSLPVWQFMWSKWYM